MFFNFFSKKNKYSNGRDPFVIKEGDIDKSELRNKRSTEWVESTIGLPDEESRSEFIGTFLEASKFRLFLAIIIFLSAVLFARVFYLQLIQGDYYKNIAEGNRIRIKVVKAPRGIIYDQKGKILAENLPSFTLSVVAADLPKDQGQRNDILRQISELTSSNTDVLSESINQIKDSSAEYYQSVPLIEELEYDKAILLKIKSAEWPGVSIDLESKRNYLIQADDFTSEGLPHLLGYVGKISKEEVESYKDKDYIWTDYVGKAGIEYTYEGLLKGIDGKEEIEVDSMGKVIRNLAQSKAESGKDIYMSIDSEVQEKAELILAQYLKKYNKTKGSVIMMNPNTGKIIAMVSLPGYDNRKFIKGLTGEEYQSLLSDESHPLFNRSIAGEYPPGSTFKLAVSAAGLEEGVITPNTTVNSVGGIRIDKWFFPDWKAGGHGLVNLRTALAWSVNTFFYMVGGGFYNVLGYSDFTGLGIEKIGEYARKFGFGSKTGIDLPGEREGFIPSKEWKEREKTEKWYIGDTYHVSIGQGDVLVTPLQIANMTSFFANGGKLFQPSIVSRVKDAETGAETKIESRLIAENIISPKNVEAVRQGLRDAVAYGSARSLLDLPVTSAGKTGTAQWNTNKDPHAWFTGFAPYNDPQVEITVLVEEGGEGSSISTAIAKDILMWYFSREVER